MTELLRQARGSLGPAGAASILRDRNLPGGAFAGNGHRATLNAFIATHATIMDLTDGIFWAASPPNQLGAFVAFDVNDFDRELPGRALPADAALGSGDPGNERLARTCLAQGRAALGDGDARAALQFAEQAESLNPGFYRNATLRGRALLALGRRDEAVRAFEASLAGAPAFLEERRELEVLLRQTQAMNP
jgi:tetratricopeptide (TPR) repeat protein